jgi:hypothetical protein
MTGLKPDENGGREVPQQNVGKGMPVSPQGGELQIGDTRADVSEVIEERRIAGLDLLQAPVDKDQNLSMNVGLGRYGEIHNLPHSILASGDETAIMNFSRTFNVASEDVARVRPWLVYSVGHDEKGYYLYHEVNQHASEVYLKTEDGKLYFDDILEQRKLVWGSPKFGLENLAQYLAAVEHSDIPDCVKADFFNRLIDIEDFEGTFSKYIPAYAGGSYNVDQRGKRLKLPTGEYLDLVQDRWSRGGFSHMENRNHSGVQRTTSPRFQEVVLIFKAIELGKLDSKALDLFYSVTPSGQNGVKLVSKYPYEQRATLDLTQPFDSKTEFPPLYLSLVLRDPRIDDELKRKLRRYLAGAIDFQCADKTGQ